MSSVKTIITQDDKIEYMNYRFKLDYILQHCTDNDEKDHLLSLMNRSTLLGMCVYDYKWFTHLSHDTNYVYNDSFRKTYISSRINDIYRAIEPVPMYTNDTQVDKLFEECRTRLKSKGWDYTRYEIYNVDSAQKRRCVIFNILSSVFTIGLIGVCVFIDIDLFWVGFIGGLYITFYTIYKCLYNIMNTYDGNLIYENNKIRRFMIRYGLLENVAEKPELAPFTDHYEFGDKIKRTGYRFDPHNAINHSPI